jgi:hypothetical protein
VNGPSKNSFPIKEQTGDLFFYGKFHSYGVDETMNGVFDTARQAFLGGTLSWSSASIKAILVSAGYTPNFATDQFLSTVVTGNRVVPYASALTLANKTIVGGVADADDLVFPNVTTGQTAQAVVIFAEGGADTNSQMIAYLDGRFRLTISANTTSQTGFTVDPLGYAIANSAVLTRVSGTGPASITLSASGGAAANGRSLTSNTAISVVLGDIYEVVISGANMPIPTNGGNITSVFDAGANKIFKL